VLYLIVGDKPVSNSGSTSLQVTNGSVDALYEVAFPPIYPFQYEEYSIPVTLLDSSGTALAFPPPTTFEGHVAPLSSVGTASASDPEPRFLPSRGSTAPPLICETAAGVPPTVRSEGLAEPMADIVFSCVGGTAGPSTPINVTVTLNTNVTSRLLPNAPGTTEACC
jgi:hypothetical protein